MHDFDVIVIGGGPAGCYAALTAANRGCRVALFEEHNAIGFPGHDPGWLMESDFTKSMLSCIEKRVPWIKVEEYRICNPESGEVIEKGTPGGYTVRRELLEQEIAALAIKAGANFYLKTKVTKLIKKNGRVTGVETNSDAIPKVNGKIVICADGIRSQGNGFAAKESLCESAKAEPGIRYLLANADVNAGIIEHYVSADPIFNYRVFFTQDNGLSFFTVPSNEIFQELKEREDNIISRKLKNAYPLEIGGFARVSSPEYGEYFKNIVRDNLMFIGDASGGAGNIHGMIQGQFAGTVASSAIKENDISEERLSEYQELVLNTLAKAPFRWFSAREIFGSFSNWFCEFAESTKGITATEIELATRQ